MNGNLDGRFLNADKDMKFSMRKITNLFQQSFFPDCTQTLLMAKLYRLESTWPMEI